MLTPSIDLAEFWSAEGIGRLVKQQTFHQLKKRMNVKPRDHVQV